jgi:hypothetical protein
MTDAEVAQILACLVPVLRCNYALLLLSRPRLNVRAAGIKKSNHHFHGNRIVFEQISGQVSDSP